MKTLKDPIDAYYFNIRIVKENVVDEDSRKHIEMLERGFEEIKGCDGELSWYSRKEGTNSFIKLHTQSMSFKEHMKKELGIEVQNLIIELTHPKYKLLLVMEKIWEY